VHKAHDRLEYDDQADRIQLIINSKDSLWKCVSHITDHPTLVCLSKSLVGKELQATFYHTLRKLSLLDGSNECYALVGFGQRACAIRIEAKELFKFSKDSKIPSFEELMVCDSIQDIQDLKPVQTMVDAPPDAHALIPPILLDSHLDGIRRS